MKTCPFCGSDLLTIEKKASAWDESVSELHVICNDCAASSPLYVWDIRSKKPQPENAPISLTAPAQLFSGITS